MHAALLYHYVVGNIQVHSAQAICVLALLIRQPIKMMNTATQCDAGLLYIHSQPE